MGPFETEREAHQAAIEAVPLDLGSVVLHAAQNHQLLAQACGAAGVELGTYDSLIIDWLAGYEDAICAVIAGLITRASQAKDGRNRVER